MAASAMASINGNNVTNGNHPSYTAGNDKPLPAPDVLPSSSSAYSLRSSSNSVKSASIKSGLASLLRSAGRKSSESLRSARSSTSSSASRRNQHPPPLPTQQQAMRPQQQHQYAQETEPYDRAKTPTADGRTTPTQAEPQGKPFQYLKTSTATTTPQPLTPTTPKPSSTQQGDGNTVAQLYAVFGLPKDPSVWTLAEEDCVAGVHHSDGAVGRFWRPEVLGCSICPSPTELAKNENSSNSQQQDQQSNSTSSKKGKSGKSTTSGSSSSNNPKYIEMSDGRGRIEKTETARVLSKALKLSFTREIEIIAGQNNYPPMASSHTFSFSVPTISSSIATLDQRAAQAGTSSFGPGPGSGSGSGSGSASSSSDIDLRRKGTGAVGVSHHKASAATGEGYGLEATRPTTHGSGLASANTAFDPNSTPATFYGVVLTVWSAADEKRTKAIQRELNRAAKARSRSSATQKDKRSKSRPGDDDDDDNDDDDHHHANQQQSGTTAAGFLPANNTFFMPYAICIVSRYPLYDLLGDWNKWAWHKYSRNIEMHNKLMSTILSKPAPRLGEHFVVDSPDGDLAFSCTFPGALEWGTGLIGVDFTMWPLFKTLTVDNILTICEIALAPNGRILFHSRYPALLGLAVETIKCLVELRGWTGIANQTCHARDVKIYLEDPGSWIIAIATELRSIFKPAKEVCVVDLDINFVHCPNPPHGAPSTKGLREKRRKRLYTALGFSSAGDFRPPREYVEAYPGGRFRPLSTVIARSNHLPYDRLETPLWWDQAQVTAAFDKTLHDGTRPNALNRLLRLRAGKKGTTSEAELAAILALRKRASTFVDARDGLENKIGRLNKRLAFLMSESEMWKAQFSKIQQLVDRLTREANDTRAKLEKERRESRRLSSSLAQRDMERVQLQLQLEETEKARTEAQTELLTMQRAMDALEHEREAMMDEIRGIISGAGADADDVAFDMSRFDLYNESVEAGSSSAHGSSSRPSSSNASHFSNLTPSQAADRIIKSRKAAEDRINAGRPSSRSSRSRQHGDSSAGHSSRRRDEDGTSAGGNHFPEDEMNYEIQQRTSSVTDQISRIQAQLENTLSHLEDRRSRRGRGRRDSDASYSSASHMRYEYRTPSSLGGGHGATTTTTTNGGNGSVAGDHSQHAGGTESEVDYDSSVTTSGYDSTGGARRISRRHRQGGGPRSSSSASNTVSEQRDENGRRVANRSTTGQGPPSAYRGPAAGSNGVDGQLSNRSRLSSRPSRDQLTQEGGNASGGGKQVQEREQVNPWKVVTPAKSGGSASETGQSETQARSEAGASNSTAKTTTMDGETTIDGKTPLDGSANTSSGTEANANAAAVDTKAPESESVKINGDGSAATTLKTVASASELGQDE
ncbi:unnamed protein product [Sympodiomycopsis kandeliae]